LGLWDQLKQRRITQIVVTYLVGGWVALEVVSTVVDRDILPGIVYRVSLTLYLFGLLVALVVGWYHGEKGEQKARPVELVLLFVILVAAAGTSGSMVRSWMADQAGDRAGEEAGLDLLTIAVLYLDDDSDDGSLAPVADGLTDGIIGALSRVDEFDVISRNGSEQVRGAGLSVDSVARILGAGSVITGSLEQDDDELVVTVRLHDGASGIEISRESYEWPADSVSTLGSELAGGISEKLREVLGIEVRVRESRSRAPTAAAWLHVARGERSLRSAVSAIRRGDAAEAARGFAEAEAAFGLAQAADVSWTEPTVLEGQAWYERVPLAESVDEIDAALTRAVERADAALAVEPNNAAAMELKATALYRRWTMQLVADPADLDPLLAEAQRGLELAVELDGSRAGAFSTLSHLYYQVGEPFEAITAARNAYRNDAFLGVIDGVLWRLYSASYDIEDYGQATEWCLRGYDRFPENFRFTQCRIFLLTMRAAGTPDVDGAWELLAELEPLLPGGAAGTLLRSLNQMALGGVIARAGLPDSANAVLLRARLTPEQDPGGDTPTVEAAMRVIMGDKDGALDVLRRYVAAHPGHFGRTSGLQWWWNELRGDPDFERIRTLN